MKLHIASLTLLALCLAVVPAVAQTDLYDNGAINGTTDAWTINSGFTVSDTFTLGALTTPSAGLSFGAWLEPGDSLVSAEVSITSSEFGGTSFFDQAVYFVSSGCGTNQDGFTVCTETGSFSGPTLNAGTYWLNLNNAVTSLGAPVYWDENSGASSASENSLGTIPSESFTLFGRTGDGSSSGVSDSTAEPSSIMLFGSGILGLAGVLRRKLF